MGKSLFFYFILTLSLFSRGSLSISEILKEHFSDNISIDQRILMLNKAQVANIEQKAKSKMDSNKIWIYEVKQQGNSIAYAVLLHKRMRTKHATILYVFSREKIIKSIEILKFKEPSEYKPNRSWQNLFIGKSKEDRLKAGYDIPMVSGATLSARGISDAARIALHSLETAGY